MNNDIHVPKKKCLPTDAPQCHYTQQNWIVCTQVHSSECELIYIILSTWLNNCGIIVVAASISIHSSLISGPLAAAQTWRLQYSSLHIIWRTSDHLL